MPGLLFYAAIVVLSISFIVSIVSMVRQYKLATSATYFVIRRKALINAWRWLFVLLISVLALVVLLIVS
nr:hypothetical protein [Anaerolineae bacterium]